MLEHLRFLLEQYKYVILFPLCVVEGPAVAVIAGFLSAGKIMHLWYALPVIVAGDVTGDTICYSMGRWGVPGFIKKTAMRFGINSDRINAVRKVFENNPIRTVALSKIVLGIGVAGIFLAGNAKIRYPKFIGVCLAVSCLQNIIYLSIGYFFGNAWMQIGRYLNSFAAISLVAGAMFILFFFIQLIRKRL